MNGGRSTHHTFSNSLSVILRQARYSLSASAVLPNCGLHDDLDAVLDELDHLGGHSDVQFFFCCHQRDKRLRFIARCWRRAVRQHLAAEGLVIARLKIFARGRYMFSTDVLTAQKPDLFTTPQRME